MSSSSVDIDDDAETQAIIQRDVNMNGTGAVVLVLCVVAAAIGAALATPELDIATPPGNITIEAIWPRDKRVDVDLWVAGPSGNPVGYSNKGNHIYNLLRDDLGSVITNDQVNMETVFSRGLPVGKHCVNLHLYSNASSATLPIPVELTLLIAKGLPDENSKMVKVAPHKTEVLLEEVGQERNAFCFKLDTAGNIEGGENGFYRSDSVHLRSATK